MKIYIKSPSENEHNQNVYEAELVLVDFSTLGYFYIEKNRNGNAGIMIKSNKLDKFLQLDSMTLEHLPKDIFV